MSCHFQINVIFDLVVFFVWFGFYQKNREKLSQFVVCWNSFNNKQIIIKANLLISLILFKVLGKFPCKHVKERRRKEERENLMLKSCNFDCWSQYFLLFFFLFVVWVKCVNIVKILDKKRYGFWIVFMHIKK